MSEYVDVLVVGAGLSGVGAAYRLQTECPDRSFTILEARDAIGGTWDLFRYPGVRSDSDMFTLGYPFRPWRHPRTIADGPAIREYIRETAAEYGIDKKIRYGQRAVSAAWSTDDARWTVRTATGEEYTCAFLYVCTGYYRYSGGYDVDFPGRDTFTGRIVHPQLWPDDLDYEGKRVVVIGSGATAVTLVPAMADKAEHVTMLQRSPSYFIALPTREGATHRLRRIMPERAAVRLVRARNVLLTWGLYQVSRRWPDRIGKLLRQGVAKQLPEGVPVDPHFVPRYNPWDQRLCVVPDGDMFAAMRAGKASVVTGTIEAFTGKGIRLTDGTDLDADIIVTATGLTMVAFGEMALTVDGRPVDPGSLHVYKGMMFAGLPNLAWCVGYTNASWTLRADLTSRYVCRLLNYMARHRVDTATPDLPESQAENVAEGPLMDLTSGYVQRAAALLPRQGTRRPWRMRNNYLTDLPIMRMGRIDDGVMRFGRATARV
ncbi:MAG TPA: NAD(P)/FAD-dependent oxidoreductase [Actinoplanes sp.]|jgi:cation diffusion facilitator CzcD-associated flavoprotein CzcO|nr:NAD(P)/FAD-dependent oxidoreductase [Actinoplanes sp.]